MKPENTIHQFIHLYLEKDESKIDDAMNLFSKKEDIEMIGIGATTPGRYEWFNGHKEIKEIILSDWANWGNVEFNLDTLKIYQNDTTAWFRICTKLEQIETNEETWEFFLNQMKSMLETKEKATDRMFNAMHYSMRRLYEKNLGKGHMWDMVITGVLIKEEDWKIHSLHWSMPVE